jgi:hypothetical protein
VEGTVLQWAKEFGLQHFFSGVVFWISQLIVVSLLVLVSYLSPGRISAQGFALVRNVAEQLQAIIEEFTGVASVLAVVMVILAGFILNLLGTRFTHIEVANFKRHLKKRAKWVRRPFEEEGIADDYDMFVSSDGNLGSATLGSHYDRLQRALFAYLDHKGTSTQPLQVAILQWRIFRSFAVTLLAFAVELVIVLAFIPILQLLAHPSLGDIVRIVLILAVVLLAVVGSVLAVKGTLKVSRTIVRHAHSQMCQELFQRLLATGVSR